MLDTRLYLLQRISALIMVPLVLLHLSVMIVAIQGGLDSAEILSRTRGSLFFGSVYGLFVLTVSIHAAIGLRVVMFEWLGIKGRVLSVFSWVAFVGLLLIGVRAVISVTAA
jgi:fumarate reductase subunit C